MLSDEEKKAIEWLKKADWFSARLYSPTILNLIEKQSKEIEELKEVKWYYEISRVPKDKIKAKIEELKEDIKYSANPLSIDNSKFAIKVLQSLLEKE